MIPSQTAEVSVASQLREDLSPEPLLLEHLPPENPSRTRVRETWADRPRLPGATVHRVELDGVAFRYETVGEGPPLLLLHRYSETTESFARFIPTLCRSFYCIGMDLRGHGGSDNPSDCFSHVEATRDVANLLDHLHLPTVAAIGVSAGAMILLRLAAQSPGRLSAMVLVGASHRLTEEARALMVAASPVDIPVSRWKYLLRRHPGGRPQILALQRHWCVMDRRGELDLPEEVLPNIRARTLLVHGELDPFVPVAIAHTLHERIPGARLWVVPGAAHLPHTLRANRAEFIARTCAFLS